MLSRLFRTLLAVALAGVTASGLWWFFLVGGTSGSRPPAVAGPEAATFTLLRADDTGAIVDGPAGYVGYTATGRQDWMDPEAKNVGPLVACLTSCPTAILSGSLDSFNVPEMPDPAPRVVGGGPELALGSHHKNRILVRSGTSMISVVQDGSGPGYLVVTASGGSSTKTVVDSTDLTWEAGSDGRSGVITETMESGTPEAARIRVYRAERTASGWVVERPQETSVYLACAGSSGRFLMGGAKPVMISAPGHAVSLSFSLADGNCAFSQSGVIVANYTMSGTGQPSTVLVLLNNGGEVMWKESLVGEARVSADPQSGSFVVTVAGRARVLAPDGSTKAEIPGVDDARYTASGRLVLVANDGLVRWQ